MCMRTTLILDAELVARAQALCGIREKTGVVHEGLEDWIRQHHWRVQQVDAPMTHGLRQSHQRPPGVGRQVKRLRDAFGAFGCGRRRIAAEDHEIERFVEAGQRPQQFARVAPDARGGRGQCPPVEANTQARPHRDTGSACERLRGMRQP